MTKHFKERIALLLPFGWWEEDENHPEKGQVVHDPGCTFVARQLWEVKGVVWC